MARERKRSTWWAYVSTLRSERSSKNMFKRFRGRFNTSDIGSLHTTPDWEYPNCKGPEVTEAPQIAEALREYYNWLFQPKPSRAADPFLRKLKQKRLHAQHAKHMEGAIKNSEVVRAIRSLAIGKAPGPDGLGGEFYRQFEHLVAHDLTAMLNEAHHYRQLPETTRSGDIILLVLYSRCY